MPIIGGSIVAVSDTHSATSDEWYAILTDEVVPRLDLGTRLFRRTASFS